MTMHARDAKRSTFKAASAFVAGAMAVAGFAGTARADTAPVSNAQVAPANVLSVSDIENRLTAQGIQVKEVELRELIAEVEGYDAQGREVELVVDRRNGETLARELDD